jgi:hypothetical protein
LEPTESIAPVSYSASPRPKMLYNGSQTYNPDQYDPFYAIYDEDGELYKDTGKIKYIQLIVFANYTKISPQKFYLLILSECILTKITETFYVK